MLVDSTFDVLDLLMDDKTQPPGEVVAIDEEIIIPKRCSVCMSSVICSVLPTFVALVKIGIYAGVERCPFFNQIKKQ